MQARGPLFDVHCHLQDPRVIHCAPMLLESAKEAGVQWLAVNGTSEEDWESVKQLSETHPAVIPCFGLHPWFVEKRSPDWFSLLRSMLEAIPTSAVGETGLDRSSRGVGSDEATQVDVLRQQLQLARELHRPAAIHCVRAFGSLQDVLGSMGSFPAGLILHSYAGSADLVRSLAKQNAYFSFSGLITKMKPEKAKGILQAVPSDRLLLETDAPDALPHGNFTSLSWVPGDAAAPDCESQETVENRLHDAEERSIESNMKEAMRNALNHPANIRQVLATVASHLGKSEEEVCTTTFQNAQRLFSFPGSKLVV